MGPPALVDGQGMSAHGIALIDQASMGAADSRRRTDLVSIDLIAIHALASMGPPTLVDGQDDGGHRLENDNHSASMGPPTLVDGQRYPWVTSCEGQPTLQWGRR